MDRLVNVVHFPHPGGEHNPGNRPVMPWNAGRHHRKFLLTSGVWRDTTDGPDRSGEVTIWGEWEPPSDVVHRWAKQPHLPTLLQEPCRTPLSAGKNLQNTDPLLFGDRFRYSNCKQFDEQHRKQSRLQDLTPGSLILFGSKREGSRQFVLDTVFVVGPGAKVYAPLERQALADDPFLIATVVEPLLAPHPRCQASASRSRQS